MEKQLVFKFEPGNRHQLGFGQAVLESFEFLRSYGLKPVTTTPTLVRYESRKVFVDVHHGRGSFEIGVKVGRRDRSEKYGLAYMVSWAGKAAWEAEGFGRGTMFQVSSREGVQQFVPRVAELVRKYGDPFLLGDKAFYRQLEEANRRASAEFTKRQVLEDIRKQAEASWSEKDFARVVELCKSMRADLTEIETRRLRYAERQSRLSHIL
ncbi:MAG TPA: hypothetical protein VK335_24350 [Bryobacteraceae bacterium]|nr:hypothetical protein [Bryobacteraceae bacterium]